MGRTLAASILAAVLAASAGAAAPKVALSGGSAAQKALVQQILAGMSPSLITQVGLTPPLGSMGERPRDLTYLSVAAGGGRKGQGDWQAWLFKGAIGDLSRRRHLPPMFRFKPAASPPPATTAGAAALEASVRRLVADTAGTSDVRIVSLRVLRPDGLAFALVLHTANPASYMKHQLPAVLDRVSNAKPERDGDYLALEDASGKIVWFVYSARRMGTGASFVSLELAGCDPIVHTPGAVGYALPPCPV